jgi:hypothetical protein
MHWRALRPVDSRLELERGNGQTRLCDFFFDDTGMGYTSTRRPCSSLTSSSMGKAPLSSIKEENGAILFQTQTTTLHKVMWPVTVAYVPEY